MSSFAKFQNDYHVTPARELYLDHIPPGNYSVNYDERTGAIYFTAGEQFTRPSRVYGKLQVWTERILNTFYDRPNTTGVLLYGIKGSGKSQLGRLVAIEAATRGVPTLTLNTMMSGEVLAKVLESFNQPVIVFIDEFEKLYSDRRNQEGLLTVLDGTLTGKVLFMLTCNDRLQVNSNMSNRPGRLLYSIEFGGVDQAFVREYAEANLTNQAHLERMVKLSTAFVTLTFDMLKAWVEEVNRYDEDPLVALELLNVSPVEHYDYYNPSPHNYSVSVTTKDGVTHNPPAAPSSVSLDPLSFEGLQVWLDHDRVIDDEGDLEFSKHDMEGANVAQGVYHYARNGASMTLTRKPISDRSSTSVFKLLNVV